jgi:hypothetical protein
MTVTGRDQQSQLITLASLIVANAVAVIEISHTSDNLDPSQVVIPEGAPP